MAAVIHLVRASAIAASALLSTTNHVAAFTTPPVVAPALLSQHGRSVSTSPIHNYYSNGIRRLSLELESTSESPEDLEAMRVPELKVLLRDRGMKVGGRKAELVERLLGEEGGDDAEGNLDSSASSAEVSQLEEVDDKEEEEEVVVDDDEEEAVEEEVDDDDTVDEIMDSEKEVVTKPQAEEAESPPLEPAEDEAEETEEVGEEDMPTAPSTEVVADEQQMKTAEPPAANIPTAAAPISLSMAGTATATLEAPKAEETAKSLSAAALVPTADEASDGGAAEKEWPVTSAAALLEEALAAAKASDMSLEEDLRAEEDFVKEEDRILPGRYNDVANSIAIPFLPRPTALDGSHAGDYGFDPCGLSEKLDFYAMQESEVRHARLAMLAAVGWPISELLAPSGMLQDGCAPSVLNGVNPISFVAIVGAIGAAALFELETSLRPSQSTAMGKLHEKDMSAIWKYGVPGDYNFDPLGWYSSCGDDFKGRKGLRDVELSHGRVAMLGITYFSAWEALTGHPIVENNMLFHPNLLFPGLVLAATAWSQIYEVGPLNQSPIEIKYTSEGEMKLQEVQRRIGNTFAQVTESSSKNKAQLDKLDDKFDIYAAPGKVVKAVRSAVEKMNLEE